MDVNTTGRDCTETSMLTLLHLIPMHRHTGIGTPHLAPPRGMCNILNLSVMCHGVPCQWGRFNEQQQPQCSELHTSTQQHTTHPTASHRHGHTWHTGVLEQYCYCNNMAILFTIYGHCEYPVIRRTLMKKK